MEDKIQLFKQLFNKSNNIVFFGGAGVSTESGILLCSCGGIIKSDVVLYEEGLDDDTLH